MNKRQEQKYREIIEEVSQWKHEHGDIIQYCSNCNTRTSQTWITYAKWYICRYCEDILDSSGYPKIIREFIPKTIWLPEDSNNEDEKETIQS